MSPIVKEKVDVEIVGGAVTCTAFPLEWSTKTSLRYIELLKHNQTLVSDMVSNLVKDYQNQEGLFEKFVKSEEDSGYFSSKKEGTTLEKNRIIFINSVNEIISHFHTKKDVFDVDYSNFDQVEGSM